MMKYIALLAVLVSLANAQPQGTQVYLYTSYPFTVPKPPDGETGSIFLHYILPGNGTLSFNGTENGLVFNASPNLPARDFNCYGRLNGQVTNVGTYNFNSGNAATATSPCSNEDIISQGTDGQAFNMMFVFVDCTLCGDGIGSSLDTYIYTRPTGSTTPFSQGSLLPGPLMVYTGPFMTIDVDLAPPQYNFMWMNAAPTGNRWVYVNVALLDISKITTSMGKQSGIPGPGNNDWECPATEGSHECNAMTHTGEMLAEGMWNVAVTGSEALTFALGINVSAFNGAGIAQPAIMSMAVAFFAALMHKVVA